MEIIAAHSIGLAHQRVGYCTGRNPPVLESSHSSFPPICWLNVIHAKSWSNWTSGTSVYILFVLCSTLEWDLDPPADHSGKSASAVPWSTWRELVGLLYWGEKQSWEKERTWDVKQRFGFCATVCVNQHADWSRFRGSGVPVFLHSVNTCWIDLPWEMATSTGGGEAGRMTHVPLHINLLQQAGLLSKWWQPRPFRSRVKNGRGKQMETVNLHRDNGPS